MAKDGDSTEVRVKVSSHRFLRLKFLAHLLAQPENEIVPMLIDEAYTRLLTSGAIHPDYIQNFFDKSATK